MQHLWVMTSWWLTHSNLIGICDDKRCSRGWASDSEKHKLQSFGKLIFLCTCLKVSSISLPQFTSSHKLAYITSIHIALFSFMNMWWTTNIALSILVDRCNRAFRMIYSVKMRRACVFHRRFAVIKAVLRSRICIQQLNTEPFYMQDESFRCKMNRLYSLDQIDKWTTNE